MLHACVCVCVCALSVSVFGCVCALSVSVLGCVCALSVSVLGRFIVITFNRLDGGAHCTTPAPASRIFQGAYTIATNSVMFYT